MRKFIFHKDTDRPIEVDKLTVDFDLLCLCNEDGDIMFAEYPIEFAGVFADALPYLKERPSFQRKIYAYVQDEKDMADLFADKANDLEIDA